MPKITAEIRSPTIGAEIYRATVTKENLPVYGGSYQVMPKTSAQTLETKDKKMKDNVSVLAIPYFEVSNTDGTTVIIGE